MLLFVGNVRAQTIICPPSTVPYPGPAWTGPITFPENISGTSCSVLVTLCVRNNYAGALEYFIESVDPVSMSGCSTLTPQQIIIGAVTALEQDASVVSSQITPPPCINGGYMVVESDLAHCWEMGWPTPPPGGGGVTPFYVPCSGATSFCETSCEWCVGPTGGLQKSDCSSTDTFNGECSDPPVDNGPWVANTCYNIHPCGN
jgi:hypothetical protein